jgi:hypothetical protein
MIDKLYMPVRYNSSGATSSGSKPVIDLVSSQEEDMLKEDRPTFVEFLDSRLRCLIRKFADRTIAATMSPGPQGFALASFPGEAAKATALPNLLLQSEVAVKPAAVLKKPASYVPELTSEEEKQQESDEEKPDTQPCAAPPVPAGACRQYIGMWYSKGSYAIRIRNGRQIFQIQNKSATKEQLQKIIMHGIKLLEEGKSEDEVKCLCKAQASTL